MAVGFNGAVIYRQFTLMEEYDKVVFSLYFPRKAAQPLTGRIIRLKSGASEVFITLLLLFLCHADITWLSA